MWLVISAVGRNQGCVWMVISVVDRNEACVGGHLGGRQVSGVFGWSSLWAAGIRGV